MLQNDETDIPTIGVIRLISRGGTRTSIGGDDSSSGISVGDSTPQVSRQPSARWPGSIYQYAQEMLDEDEQFYSSVSGQPYQDIPSIGVIKLVSDQSRPQTLERRVSWAGEDFDNLRSFDERETFTSSSTTQKRRRSPSPDKQKGNFPTIGVIKLIRPDSLKQPLWNELNRYVAPSGRSSLTRHESWNETDINETQRTGSAKRPQMIDSYTEPAITWPQLIHTVRDLVDEEQKKTSKSKSKKAPILGVFKLKSTKEKTPKVSAVSQGTNPDRPWHHLVSQLEEEIESSVIRKTNQRPDRSEPRTVSIVKLQAPHQPTPDTRTKGTNPDLSWNQVLRMIQSETEEIVERKQTLKQKTPSNLGSIQLKSNPKPPMFDCSTQPELSWPQVVKIIKEETEEFGKKPFIPKNDKGIQPEMNWPEIIQLVQQEVIKQVRETEVTKKSEQKSDKVPLAVIKLVGAEDIPKLKQDQTTEPELSWGQMVRMVQTEVEDIIRTKTKKEPKRKETGDASTEPELTWPLLVRIVQEEVENMVKKKNTKTTSEKGTRPENDWNTVVGTIQETAIEEFKRISQKKKPKDEKPPLIGIFKLKAQEQPQVTSVPRPRTVEQGTHPSTSWDRLLSRIEENAIMSIKRTSTKQKAKPAEPTSIGIIKLRAPDVSQKTERSTQSEDIDVSHSFTQPERSWRDLLRGLKLELESEYMKTIRELEAHIASQEDHPDYAPTVQSLGVLTLKAPREEKKGLRNSFTQYHTPVISEKFTQSDKSWPELMMKIEEETERKLTRRVKTPKVSQQESQTEEEIPALFLDEPIAPSVVPQEFASPVIDQTDSDVQVGPEMADSTSSPIVVRRSNTQIMVKPSVTDNSTEMSTKTNDRTTQIGRISPNVRDKQHQFGQETADSNVQVTEMKNLKDCMAQTEFHSSESNTQTAPMPEIVPEPAVIVEAPTVEMSFPEVKPDTRDASTATLDAPKTKDQSLEVAPDLEEKAVSAWKVSLRSFTTQFDTPLPKTTTSGQQTSVSVLEKGTATLTKTPGFAGVQVSPVYETHSTSVEKTRLTSTPVQVTMKKDTKNSTSNTDKVQTEDMSVEAELDAVDTQDDSTSTIKVDVRDSTFQITAETISAGAQVTSELASTSTSAPRPATATKDVQISTKQVDRQTLTDEVKMKDAGVTVDLSSKKQVVNYYLEQLKKKPKVTPKSSQCDLIVVPKMKDMASEIKPNLRNQQQQMTPVGDNDSTQYDPVKVTNNTTQLSIVHPKVKDSSTQSIPSTKTTGALASTESRDISTQATLEPEVIEQVVITPEETQFNMTWSEPPKTIETSDASTFIDGVDKSNKTTETYVHSDEKETTTWTTSKQFSLQYHSPVDDFTHQMSTSVLDKHTSTDPKIPKDAGFQVNPVYSAHATQISRPQLTAKPTQVKPNLSNVGSNTVPVKTAQMSSQLTQVKQDVRDNISNTDVVRMSDKISEADIPHPREEIVQPEKVQPVLMAPRFLKPETANVSVNTDGLPTSTNASTLTERVEVAIGKAQASATVKELSTNTSKVEIKSTSSSADIKIIPSTASIGGQVNIKPSGVDFSQQAEIHKDAGQDASMNTEQAKIQLTAVNTVSPDVKITAVNTSPAPERKNTSSQFTLQSTASSVMAVPNVTNETTQYESSAITSSMNTDKIEQLDQQSYVSMQSSIQTEKIVMQELPQVQFAAPVFSPPLTDTQSQVTPDQKDSSSNTKLVDVTDSTSQIQPAMSTTMSAVHPETENAAVGVFIGGQDFAQQAKIEDLPADTIDGSSNTVPAVSKDGASNTSPLPVRANIGSQVSAATSVAAVLVKPDIAVGATITTVNAKDGSSNTSPLPKLADSGSQISIPDVKTTSNETQYESTVISSSSNTDTVVHVDKSSLVNIPVEIKTEQVIKEVVPPVQFSPPIFSPPITDTAAQISPEQKDSSSNTISASVKDTPSQITPDVASTMSTVQPTTSDMAAHVISGRRLHSAS